MSGPILPGSTLGILGGGQLGRMLALAARRMGYRVHVLTSEDDAPCSQLADRTVCAPLEDLDAIHRFAASVDVVTLEFENIPYATVQAIEQFAPVRPGGHVLHTTQHRLREKTFLRDHGLPTPHFAAIESAEQIVPALHVTGLPAVLKTAAWGYDGQGQRAVRSIDEANRGWFELQEQPLIAEQFVDFECELSVIGARALSGQFVHYGPVLNDHQRHILDLSLCPAGLSEAVTKEAIDITRTVFEQLEVVGVLCVEFFLTKSGQLLINELAPRPHNSGHLTIEGHATSQFEQQLRAVCGLPLGSTKQWQPAAMANLLGDLWLNGEPNWTTALAAPETYLHLYGKQSARKGRKMGHLTVVAAEADEARRRVLSARASLNAQ